MHIVPISLRKFVKNSKNGRAFFAQLPRISLQPPLQLKKNPNNALCSGENSLQPDKEIKSLAILKINCICSLYIIRYRLSY